MVFYYKNKKNKKKENCNAFIQVNSHTYFLICVICCGCFRLPGGT
nr:MAG TPA: hypothetical protein [Caudoviricetes sp.]